MCLMGYCAKRAPRYIAEHIEIEVWQEVYG